MTKLKDLKEGEKYWVDKTLYVKTDRVRGVNINWIASVNLDTGHFTYHNRNLNVKRIERPNEVPVKIQTNLDEYKKELENLKNQIYSLGQQIEKVNNFKIKMEMEMKEKIVETLNEHMKKQRR